MLPSDSPVKRIGCNLLFVVLLSCLIVLCDIRYFAWRERLIILGWHLMFLLLAFWMVRRGSRVACVLIILGCLLNIPLSLITAHFSSRSLLIKGGFFVAVAISYGVFVISLSVAVFRKKFLADPQFLKSLNRAQWCQLFGDGNPFINLIRRFFTSFHGIFAVLTLIGSAYVCWNNFHPEGSFKSMDGPAGKVNRAFHEPSDRKDETYLYAADWPYTFERPFSMGDDSGLENKSHWSADGSLLFRVHRDYQTEELYISALYDYREHQWYDFSSHVIDLKKLERLVKERGGRGPRVRCLWK
jgi:hypothetical protein